MTQNESRSSTDEQEPTSATLELYKTAFARLNFQDEYLFKFSTVFLTAQGALAVLAGSSATGGNSPNYPSLAIVSAIGLFLAFVWWLWTRHNDYWHSVWTGTLIDIEKKHLGTNTKARVFDQDHSEIAKRGKRSGCFVPRGHWIAQLVPIVFAVAWAVAFALSLYKVLSICK